MDIYSHYVIICDKVYQWFAAGQWFSPVSSTNKTDRYDITEILLKVALNTINQTIRCVNWISTHGLITTIILSAFYIPKRWSKQVSSGFLPLYQWKFKFYHHNLKKKLPYKILRKSGKRSDLVSTRTRGEVKYYI